MYYLLPASRSNLTIPCRVPSLFKGDVFASILCKQNECGCGTRRTTEKKRNLLHCFSDCFGLSSAFFMIQHSPGSPRKDGDSDTLMVSRNTGVSVFASLAEMIFEMYYLLPASRSNLTIRCRVPSLLKGNVSASILCKQNECGCGTRRTTEKKRNLLHCFQIASVCPQHSL